MIPPRRPGPRFITSAVFAVTTCGSGFSVGASEVARPAVSQIVALPSPDRVSLVIELTDAVERASLTSGADAASTTIEIGPLRAVTPQQLVSAPDLNVISSVAVRSFQEPPETFARVVVQLRTACHQKVRVAGRRVYLDLVPLRPASPASTAVSTASAGSTPSATSATSAASGKNLATENPIDQAYRSLESDGLRRAKALATQANVKALEALRQEVIRRDTQLGGRRVEMMSHLLDEIDRYTDEARALRLKLDGLLFRKSQS